MERQRHDGLGDDPPDGSGFAASDVPACGCGSPGEADPATCYCGVENLLRVIRRRYSLAVLSAIHSREPARFRDLELALPAASTSTLAETLRALTAARLVEREGPGEAVPVTAYTLTMSGRKLLNRLRPLLAEVQDGAAG